MKNLLAIIAIAMVSICLEAATPSYNDFNPAYFTRSGNTIGINPTNLVSGAGATNVFLGGAQPGLVTTNSTGNWTITGNVSTSVSNWVTSVSGSGTSGAVTNNDTREIFLPYTSIGDYYNTITFTNYLRGGTNATLTRKNIYTWTNATSGMVYWDFGAPTLQGFPTITNAAHSDPDLDYAAIADSNYSLGTTMTTFSDGGGSFNMRGTWSVPSSNNIFAKNVSAETYNAGRIAQFGSRVATPISGAGLADDSSSIQVNINQNSDDQKIGIAVINKYQNLTEMYLENQDGAGNRSAELVWGVNGINQAFIGSSALLRFIDPVSPYPHINLLTVNRTNGVVTVSNLVVAGTMAGNGSGLSNTVDLIAGDSSVTIVTNANKRSFTITATGSGGTNGSPTTISNNYFVASSSSATYTNSTANWLFVSTELYQSAPVTTTVAEGKLMVDTNVDGTLDKLREYWWETNQSNIHIQSSAWVPPGASYQWTNTTGNMAIFNLAIQQTYVIAGSGGGSGAWTGNPNQFTSSGGQTNFKSGALVTNLLADTLYGTNSAAGTNFAILDEGGSVINGVGLTNNNVTIPGTLNVSGATTIDTVIATTVTGNGSGITNIPVSALTTNGGTPGQVVTAQANGTVTWSNAPASSGGSPVTFDASQFGSSVVGTNLLSGALVTNLTFSGKEFGVYVTNSENNGIQFRAKEDNSVIATLRSSDGISGSGSGLTQLNASSISSGSVADARLGNALLKSGGVMTGGLGMTGFTNLASGLGTTITPYEWLSNSTLAAVGAQQVSPALMLGGNGWSTTGTTSSPVAMGFYTLPAQGTTPSAALHFLQSLNGASPTSIANISSAGVFTINNSFNAGANVFAASSSLIGWPSKCAFYNPINGVISVVKADLISGPDFFLLGGGNSASTQWQSTNWPALRVVASTNNPTLGISLGTNTTLFASLIASNIQAQGFSLATNGMASFSTTAVATIAATGWTNIWSTNNATVYVTATAISFTIKDRAQTTLYTSPTLTTTIPVTLQPGWALTAASGLSGTALPW